MLTLFSEGTLMHVRRALALAVVVPLLLAGCSDDPAPTPKMPDPTPSSATPTPTVSETPEVESAEDFIRRWVKAGDEMQVTGETAEFRKLSRNCQACAQVADQVESIYSRGGSIEFDGSEVDRMRRIASNPPTFNLDLKTAETVIRSEGGAVDQRLPEGVGLYLVTLNGKPGAWYVAAYARR